MPVRAHMPGYRWFQIFKSASVRTGVYAGVLLSVAVTSWVYVANRMPVFEHLAMERNIAALALLGVLACIPIIRFLRMPGRLLIAGLVAWSLLSITYGILSLHFPGLVVRHSASQIFMLGAILYLIASTLCWIGTIIWRVRASHAAHAPHSRH